MKLHARARFALAKAPILIVAAASAMALAACDEPKKSGGGAPSATTETTAPIATASTTVSAAPSASAPGDASAPITAETFCDRVFLAVATRFEAACSEEDKKESGYTLAAAFAHMPHEECDFVLRDGVASGRLAFDQAVAEKCAAAADSSAKAQVGLRLVVPDLDELAECKGLVTGKQGADQPCKTTIECKDGLTCIGAHGKENDGACKPVPTKAGEACDGAIFRMHDLGHRPKCGPGLECDLPDAKNTTPICRTAKAAGAACVDSDECAGELWCKAGKCASGPAGDVGEACVDDADDCKQGLFCDRAKGAKAGKCAAKRAAGQACADVFECRGECRKPEGKAQGTCAAICGSG